MNSGSGAPTAAPGCRMTMPTPRASSGPANTARTTPGRSERSRKPVPGCLAFVRWYNHEHKHRSLKFVSPAERHRGQVGLAPLVIFNLRTYRRVHIIAYPLSRVTMSASVRGRACHDATKLPLAMGITFRWTDNSAGDRIRTTGQHHPVDLSKEQTSKTSDTDI